MSDVPAGTKINNLAEELEQELEEPVEVKSKKSLHCYIVLLTENVVQKSAHQQVANELKSDLKVFAETMKEGFKAVDKRLEDMNRRFNMMIVFMNIGFGIFILLTILFKFMQ